jgi:Rhodopirellula transposase DDE domain
MVDREPIRQRWETFGSKLDERGRRLFAAAEVRTAGRGGLAAIAEITGLARSTIGRGLEDLDAPALPDNRVRREGGGRHEIADVDATLVPDLQHLAEPMTMGDPMRPLKWVSKSPAKLAAALRESGHEVSPNTVAKLLETKLEYSRQVNRKTQSERLS